MSQHGAHLSIGEVIVLLQDEFPDVTISKIRFLESQGLIDPERTPSGYRKFYDTDIERLRWILRQQRQHFLPLKVIKQRLASGDVDFDAVTEIDAAPGSSRARESSSVSLLQEAPNTATRGRTAVRDTSRRRASRRSTPGDVHLTREEMATETGLTARELGELEKAGMVVSQGRGGNSTYDAEALRIAKLVTVFRSHGVELRHLRMYKVAAEREAGVFEQLVVPRSRRRTAEARAQAASLVEELIGLGDEMREAMLRQLLRDHLDGG